MPPTLPNWDLSNLYNGISDPKLERDKKRIHIKAKQFSQKYAHAISVESTIEEIQGAITEYEKLLLGTAKVSVFASLVFATDRNNPNVAAYMQSVSEWAAEVQQDLLFFDLLISSLPSETLTELRQHPTSHQWRHWLLRMSKLKKHRLSEKEEALLLETTLTGKDAFTRLFEQEDASREFVIKNKHRTQLVHEPELLSRLHHHDRTIRRQAAETLNEGIAKDVGRSAFIYNMIIKSVLQDTKRRNFAAPEGMRHLDNELTAEAVEALVSTVTGHYGLVHEYYVFKRKQLKLPRLFEYDRYAPIATSTKRYSFTQAKTIILNSFDSFSPVFRRTAELFFDNHWIDAKPKAGKSGGAFCAYATPNTNPYILMNYTGTMNDVMTLAHELGHGVHAYLARKQSYLHYNWPISIAEIASLFAEMIVFNSLKQTLNHHQQFALHSLKVEGIIASVFRQVTMFEFEREVYRRRMQGELPPEVLSTIWKEKFQAMYGSSVIQSKGSELQWSIIPHFFSWPFYVYAYAFGDLLTRSLFAAYTQDPAAFVPAYLAMLEAGGSQSPNDLLTGFGADIEKRTFWEGGMEEVRRLIEETKRLA